MKTICAFSKVHRNKLFLLSCILFWVSSDTFIILVILCLFFMINVNLSYLICQPKLLHSLTINSYDFIQHQIAVLHKLNYKGGEKQIKKNTKLKISRLPPDLDLLSRIHGSHFCAKETFIIKWNYFFIMILKESHL